MKSLTTIVTLLSWAAAKVSAGKLSPTDTITWGGDNSRTGYSGTHNMDPAVVGSPQFGQLWKASFPGNYKGYLEQIYSQPLLYTLDDGIQYVFIATTQNNVYKLNAKTGAIVAQRNLHIPFLTADLNGCVDINPTVGVTATGVIDPSTDTWYLTAKTYDDQTDQVKGLNNGRYWFHAIDVNNLKEKTGFPKGLEGVTGSNNANRMFNGGIHHQRPALLHTGQYVYAGFASHCVQWNFTGWIMGWDKTTGSLVEHFVTEAGPEKNSIAGGGVWMSGGGLATDNKGSMYFSTGNGYASQLSGTPVPGRQPPTSLEEAAVNMRINDDGTVKVVDFFMPWEKVQLDGADKDLGTSPLELLQTDVFTCPNVKRMGVVTGKSGKTYILNLDSLGGYQQGANKLDAVPQVFQNENSVYAGAGVYPGEGGYLYINVIQYPTHVFKFSCNSNGDPVFTKIADSPEKNAYVLGVGHGTTTSLNGQAGSGLVWVSDVDGFNLRVYNAIPVNGKLNLIKTANIPGVTKFARPVFGDGRAYIGTTQGALYCFGSPVNLPLTCTSPNDFGKQLLNSTSAPKTIQCQANVATQVTSMALKGNPNFQISQQPTLPVTLSAGQNISFQAVFAPNSPGPLSSDVVIGTTNGVTGYSTSTPVSLKGNGDSLAPLLAVTPNTISFSGVITGEQAGGVTQSVIWSNNGDGALHITNIGYSTISETGATVAPNKTADGVQVGPFTFKGVPDTIAGGDSATVDINFNPTTSGNFAVYVTVQSDGGKKIFDVVATAGTYPKAVLEFQAADGSGKWIPYTNNDPPFSFGDVYEQHTKQLKMRLTNNGSSSAASLSVTVSKPPFGVSGIVGANNGVDLAEGTVLGAGESATATLYCSVPKLQVNTDSYNGSAQWTMNTGDPSFGKQFIQFECNAVSEQVGPLASNGSALYRYDGCWKENNPGRQLKVQLWGQNSNNSNGLCINACADKGYTYAATQYVDECWCGNTGPNLQVNETQCNYQCSGDDTETCGGNGYFHDGSYLSLFANGNASANTGAGAGPGVVKSVGAYNYSGCYTEGTSGRALGAKNTASDDMTIERCASSCIGYTYFGVEYGSECYCGNILGTGSVKTTEGDCSMNCPGKTTEICGAGNRLTLYTLTSQSSGSSSLSSTASATSAPTPKATDPIAVQTAGGFSYQGCYSEGTNARALAATNTASNAMTVQKCAAFCSGYKYMGVEYASECFCANSISAGSALVASGCDMTCSGDPTTLCGGPNRLSFYSLSSSSTSSTSSSSSQSSSQSSSLASSQSSSQTSSQTSSSTTVSSSQPTGPTVVQKAGAFTYQGCYNEIDNGRALADSATYGAKMTVETCATYCSGYAYMAIEFGSECYCGNKIDAASTLQTSGCSMACGGDDTEICGGGSRLSLYKGKISGPSIVQQAGTFAYKGCYTEATAGRALSEKQNAGASNTVEQCSTFCSGYKYMGVEYGQECYCGNTINAGAVTATSGCSMTCAGDSTEYCGGPSRLNMYERGVAQTSSSVSQSSTSQSSTSQSSSSKSTATSMSSFVSSSATSSKLSSISSSATSSQSSSVSSSVTSSKSSSVSLSVTSSKSSSVSSSTTSSSLSSTSSKPASTSAAVVQAAANFSYTACYVDSVAARALPKQVAANNQMTVESCLSACDQYTYAALEYGRECWCGNSIASTATKATAESQCNMKCLGDATELCGSSNRLTLYTHNPAKVQAKLAFAKPASAASTSSISTSSSSSPSLSRTSSSSSAMSGSSSSVSSTFMAISSSQSSVSSPSTSKSSSQASSTSSKPSVSSSSSSTSQSSSSSSKTTLLPTPSQTIGSYSYLGCANQTSPLALVGMSKTDSKEMTTETCQKYCVDNNYGLAATQNGDTCYCGNGLQSYSAVGQNSCDVPCAGNSTEICGGENNLSIWNSTSVTIPPTTVKAVGYYALDACYSGSNLLKGASHTSATGLTVESCVGFCITKGYQIAGIQDGKTCYCDSKLATTAKKESLESCNVLCAGNTREFCGASGYSLVYQYDLSSVTNGVPKSMNQENKATITANTTSSA